MDCCMKLDGGVCDRTQTRMIEIVYDKIIYQIKFRADFVKSKSSSKNSELAIVRSFEVNEVK